MEEDETFKTGDILAVTGLLVVTYARKKSIDYHTDSPIVVEYVQDSLARSVGRAVVLKGNKIIKPGDAVTFYKKDARPFWNQAPKDDNLLFMKNHLPEL